MECVRQNRLLFVFCALALACASTTTVAQSECGLAGRYPNDVDIQNDPSTVFVEKFEQSTVDEFLTRWEDWGDKTRLQFDNDKPTQSNGEQSLLFNGETHTYRRLLSDEAQDIGYDQLFVRFYAKFDPSCNNVHHYHWLGGHQPSTSYPWPRAGTRPNGDERFSTGIEPMGGHWAWDFYSYWMNMRTNPYGNFWGNDFGGDPSPHTVDKGQWIAVEFMVKMNVPVTESNGEQAFWINGDKKMHLRQGSPNGNWVWDSFIPDPNGEPFEGFQWRSVPNLNINYLWLQNYVDADPSCRTWIDDLVVATEYIGPISANGCGTTDGPPPPENVQRTDVKN